MKITELGQLVKQRRVNLRIQQKDLAELSGVALRTIIQIENGSGNPSLETLNKLTRVLGMQLVITIHDK
jgi:transcriptional regulator with XRE-family HTH domain